MRPVLLKNPKELITAFGFIFLLRPKKHFIQKIYNIMLLELNIANPTNFSKISDELRLRKVKKYHKNAKNVIEYDGKWYAILYDKEQKKITKKYQYLYNGEEVSSSWLSKNAHDAYIVSRHIQMCLNYDAYRYFTQAQREIDIRVICLEKEYSWVNFHDESKNASNIGNYLPTKYTEDDGITTFCKPKKKRKLVPLKTYSAKPKARRLTKDATRRFDIYTYNGKKVKFFYDGELSTLKKISAAFGTTKGKINYTMHCLTSGINIPLLQGFDSVVIELDGVKTTAGELSKTCTRPPKANYRPFLVGDKRLTVNELVQHTGMSQPSVSKLLKNIKEDLVFNFNKKFFGVSVEVDNAWRLVDNYWKPLEYNRIKKEPV